MNNHNNPPDLFDAGLQFAEDMAEFLMALMMMLQFILEAREIKQQEDRKREIYKNLEMVQRALDAGSPPEQALKMLTINFYEISDLLKQRRALNNQPELSFKQKLTAYRKISEDEIKATLHRRLRR